MTNPTRAALLLLLLMAPSCADQVLEEDIDLADDGEGDKEDAWNAENNPSFVDSTLIYEIDALPVKGRAKQTPWPGDYWPAANDSLNARWDGASSKSPAEKYATAFGKPGLTAAITEKLGVYGHGEASCTTNSDCDNGATCSRPRGVTGANSGRCVPGWYGICNGWTGAAIREPAPRKPVVRNGVTFYPGDLEALMSMVYYYPVPTKYLGARCNETGAGTDGNGRPRDGECRDLNPGALFVIASNFLGLRGQAFAEDRVGDAEVWNQPVLGFQVKNATNGKLVEVSASEATKLVTGRAGTYTFNPKAKRFFHVVLELSYVTESEPERTSRVDDIDTYTRTDEYKMVIEADAAGRVIGGEYIGDSKDDHPDFIWWITGKPYGFLPGGVKYADVKEMFTESAGGAAVSHESFALFTDKAVSGSSVYATVGVPPNGKLTVTMTGTGDADLYVRLGRKPTTSSYDKKSTGTTSRETVTLTAGEAGGTYYVRVKPNKASTVSVTAVVE